VRISSFLSIGWKGKTLKCASSVFYLMVSPWVGECMFAGKFGKLSDYLMPLLHQALLFLRLLCLPCHPMFYLCASCIISPGLHTFGFCGSCKYSQASEKNQKQFVVLRPFVATNVLIFELPNFENNLCTLQ
jgi:hypothetical protein